ncbi:MAG: GerMN domain-containing protein [Clostridiales bacterium]|nr:GerMN domain-containing protein [Clostridiales bacterium]
MTRKGYALVAALLAVIAAAIVIIISINKDRPAQKTDVDLYFINNSGNGIASETRKLHYKDETDLIRNALEKLRQGPSSSKLNGIMPKDTQISDVELLGGGFLTVNFSDGFLSEDPSRNVLNVYAVVKTLCTTVGVSSVQVLVDGQPVRDRDNKPLGYISASDINLETEEYSSEMMEVTLYFADSSGKKLKPEKRTIKITDQQPVEQYLINELINGTESKELKSILSKKTVLVSADVDENICYLNFKANFLDDNSGTTEHEKLVIYSIVNSLTELNTISKVQFYMDGKRVDKFGSVSIKNHIGRNTGIINEEDKE